MTATLVRVVVSVGMLGVVIELPTPASAQWTNRYPKVDGYGHHVYLEGYELPTMNVGPTDPVVSPDGGSVAFSARGWIWVLELETGVARRVTRGRDLDFRPAWSPDGASLAYVRDNDHETSIVRLDLQTGEEDVLVDTPALDLDPVFSPDGRHLYYASAVAGDLDLWRRDLDTGTEERVTTDPGIELRPQVAAGQLVFLAKGSGRDQVRLRSLDGAGTRVLRTGRIASMTRPALSPDGRTVAVNWPTQEGWDLLLMGTDDPLPAVLLVGGGLPLSPAWSPDGRNLMFVEADDRQRMVLKSQAAAGGPVRSVPVLSWDWAEPTGTVRIRTRTADGTRSVPSRLEVKDASGHPAIPDGSTPRFDGQNGRVFFYSPGVIEVTVPVGEITVAAVRGLATPEVVTRVVVETGQSVDADLELTSVWNARAEGWTSGEHHFHLNYGGPYDLAPDDLVLMMRAEELDVATPLLANLHNRFEDQDLWRWAKTNQTPIIRFGQEIRSHFLGHLGLIGIDDLYWPWVWGPGYQVYGEDDRPNADPLRHARAQDGFGYYVHPVSDPDPFSETGAARVPIALVTDAVLGDLDGLEVVCIWSDELGTTEVWYRFLNLGIPVAPSAGTDVMNDYYRTMAVGTTRVYADTGNRVGWSAYLDALRAGRTFVTNGPLLRFAVGGAGPGAVVTGSRRANWTADLATAVPVERVEIVVNGRVVETRDGLDAAGARLLRGTIDLPAGGWIAARAHGGNTVWPAMDSYPFAHTAPVWIDAIGSTDGDAARRSAGELLELLTVAETRLLRGYGEAPIPRLRERFRLARAELERRVALP